MKEISSASELGAFDELMCECASQRFPLTIVKDP